MEAYDADTYLVLISNLYSEQAAGTYAWEDLDQEWTFVIDYTDDNKKIYFTDGSCTVTVDGGNITVSGSFTDEDGNTYDVTITYTAPAHTHSFTYTADGATITAACTEDCDITEGLTLTISAPTGTLVWDGRTAFTASLNDDYNITAFPGEYAITYTKDGEAYTGDCTDTGTYVASVTVGEATASVSYTVRNIQYTITWLNDDGSVIDTTTVEYGTVPTHADPAKAATAQYTYTFAGWSPAIVQATADATYTATYTAIPVFGTPTFTLPKNIKTIEESAFEGLPMTIVEIPTGCTSIGANAFKDCTNLNQIRIPASVTSIDTTAFDGCANVLVYGATGSAAQTFCGTHDNCTFIAENAGE